MDTETEVVVQVYIRNRNPGSGMVEFRESFDLPQHNFSDIAAFFSRLHEFFGALKKNP